MGIPLPAVGQLSLSLRRVPKNPKPKSLEKDIERAIGDYLRVRGVFFWKQPQAGFFDTNKGRFRKHASPYARNGVPDLIAVIKGRLVGFEVKAPGGTQSDAQKDFEKDLRDAGGLYYIVKSIEDVDEALTFVREFRSIY